MEKIIEFDIAIYYQQTVEKRIIIVKNCWNSAQQSWPWLAFQLQKFHFEEFLPFQNKFCTKVQVFVLILSFYIALALFSSLKINIATSHPGTGLYIRETRYLDNQIRGETWGGMGMWHPPPQKKKQKTNHLDWQGESSGFAGQSKILNDRM